jgi:uncharacterized protein
VSRGIHPEARVADGGIQLIRVWAKDQPFGAELADMTLWQGTLSATGFAIGTEPVPYRLEYQLETTKDFVTRRLRARSWGNEWHRWLDLQRDASGTWSSESVSEGDPILPFAGGDMEHISGALDCDLGLSPLTNSMPVLRHRLLEGGGPIDFLMAWVSVPDLSVHRSLQRYTFIRREPDADIVRYENRDGTFTADLSFDDAGVVIDYPGLARRVA